MSAGWDDGDWVAGKAPLSGGGEGDGDGRGNIKDKNVFLLFLIFFLSHFLFSRKNLVALPNRWSFWRQ